MHTPYGARRLFEECPHGDSPIDDHVGEIEHVILLEHDRWAGRTVDFHRPGCRINHEYNERSGGQPLPRFPFDIAGPVVRRNDFNGQIGSQIDETGCLLTTPSRR